MKPSPHADPFKLLLALIAGVFVLVPFFAQGVLILTSTRLAIEIVIIAAVAVTRPSRLLLAFVVAVAVANEATTWLSLSQRSPRVALVSEVSELVFIATTFWIIARNAWEEDSVDASLFAAVIAAYFMLGFFWASAFSTLELLEPGSFSGACPERPTEIVCSRAVGYFPRLGYLSFVTLTTLGYGDILPATRRAEGLAAMASVSGQLYIAIVIGRIISISVSKRS